MDRRRLLLYLLLNVFISACVTGAILFWYDRNYRAATLSPVQPAPVSNDPSAPQPTFNPQVDIPVEIVSIVGAGTMTAESVVIRNAGADCSNGKLILYVDGRQVASVYDSTYTSDGVAVFA